MEDLNNRKIDPRSVKNKESDSTQMTGKELIQILSRLFDVDSIQDLSEEERAEVLESISKSPLRKPLNHR